MTTAKQKAREELSQVLRKELEAAKYNARQNLREFKKLHLQQEVLKRKVAEAHRLIIQLEKL